MSSTSLPKSASLSRIPSLDGLRALSIFLVVALHTLQRYSLTHPVSRVILLSPVIRVLLTRSHNPALHYAGIGFFKYDFIMFGCLVALLQHTPYFESIYRAATRFAWLAPFAILLFSGLTARYQNYFDLPIGYTINGVAIAVFLLWCTRNPSSIIGRVLNWKPIMQIGVLSYSIYLWQTLFLHTNNSQIFGTQPEIATWVSTFPGNWLAILIVASISYYFVERPSLRARSTLIHALRFYTARRRDRKAQLYLR
jgi:peptidoglycan/LPS O-acetylase OafA/YrhL